MGVASVRARELALGFIAGALAVATVHQLTIFLLGTVGLSSGQVYSLRPIPPFAVPSILNQMFWGGLWGALFAALADRLPQWPRALVGLLFGLLGPVLVGWTLVAYLKGNPLFAGFVPLRMLAGALINGAFGIGVALIYPALRRAAETRRANSRAA